MPVFFFVNYVRKISKYTEQRISTGIQIQFNRLSNNVLAYFMILNSFHFYLVSYRRKNVQENNELLQYKDIKILDY